MPDHPPPARRPPLRAALLAIATGIYALVLVFATHYPKPEELLGPNAPGDKTLHFIAYGLLAFLAAATVSAWQGRSTRGWLRLAVALAGFGVLDEVTQPFFSRAADPLDWVYDLIGIGCGLAAVAAIARLSARAAAAGERGQ